VYPVCRWCGDGRLRIGAFTEVRARIHARGVLLFSNFQHHGASSGLRPRQRGTSVRAWQPPARDVEALLVMLHLRHVTAKQMRSLVFHQVESSRTSCDRSLARLHEHGYIYRYKEMSRAGGGGFYVYRLTRLGHSLVSDTEYKDYRGFVDHSLTIGDCVVALHELEREGSLAFVGGIEYEDDCDFELGGKRHEPDMFADVEHVAHGRIKLMHEVDCDTEGPAYIRAKLWKYLNAYRDYTDGDIARWSGVLPRVVWVCTSSKRPEELRAKAIQKLVDELPRPADHVKIFRVLTLAEYKDALR
jgi:hypothetical protein